MWIFNGMPLCDLFFFSSFLLYSIGDGSINIVDVDVVDVDIAIIVAEIELAKNCRHHQHIRHRRRFVGVLYF